MGFYLEDYIPESVEFLWESVLKGISYLSKITSKRLEDEREIKKEVSRESSRLNIEESIDVHFSLKDDSRSRRNDNGKLELYIGGFFSKKAGVRHEIYHLYKHADKPFSRLKYLWIEEPQALIYEILRIKFNITKTNSLLEQHKAKYDKALEDFHYMKNRFC